MPSGQLTTRCINACLCPVGSLDGCSVVTVEGLGNAQDGFNPVQGKLALAPCCAILPKASALVSLFIQRTSACEKLHKAAEPLRCYGMQSELLASTAHSVASALLAWWLPATLPFPLLTAKAKAALQQRLRRLLMVTCADAQGTGLSLMLVR